MATDRRAILTVGLAASIATGAGVAADAASRTRAGAASQHRLGLDVREAGAAPDTSADQTDALQVAIDQAAQMRLPLLLAPGRYLTRTLRLRPGTRIAGVGVASVLEAIGGQTVLSAEGVDGIEVSQCAIDGGPGASTRGKGSDLVALSACADLELDSLVIRNAPANAVALAGCSGTIRLCRIRDIAKAAIFSLDAKGLQIANNDIARCANNGILVWRSQKGEDGTIVAHNHITSIETRDGGSGQNGNGINVFRAGGVIVTGNRIADCAYSAVRGNAADDMQVMGNNCARLGEVAIYAEFGFQGAVITSNIVDGAAAGISVTNFNDGGRLAVVQGNLIRNLSRREHEPVDKRGEGISAEADAAVSGNVIENAPTVGILIGWGRYMRNVSVTGNMIRGAPIGIVITSDKDAGSCLVAHNTIAGATDGAIRAMDHGRAFGPDLTDVAPDSRRVFVAGNLKTPG